MINKLIVRNFKSIEKANLSFGKLNILCGENASGKTSIIHSILIATQKTQDDYTADGSIIKIGELSELRNRKTGKDVLIKINCKSGTKTIRFTKNEDVSVNKDSKLIVTPNPSDIIPFEETLFYLSSSRVGVVDTYSKGNYLFGTSGEAVIDFLYKQQDEQFSEDLMTLFNKAYKGTKISENRNFIEHVRYWMEYITSESITINSVPNTNQYVLSFGSGTRPINTGSGYSFLLPIVIVCLGAILVGKDVPTVILENPEIYLHPEAQAKLVEFFIFCQNFIQLIVETHSEHIIKNVMDYSETECKIFVVQLDKQTTVVTPMTQANFKTRPISYTEVIYKAFGIATPELHISLYSQLHVKYNASIKATESTISKFDKYLFRQPRVTPKQWRYQHNGSIREYKTLPTFIRNKIDHLDGKDPTTHQIYEYSEEEFKKSIDWMLQRL